MIIFNTVKTAASVFTVCVAAGAGAVAGVRVTELSLKKLGEAFERRRIEKRNAAATKLHP